MQVEHAQRRLAGADAELEDRAGLEPGGGCGRARLELAVAGNLADDGLEVLVRREVVLVDGRRR
jgi:hypothetical protein